VLREDSEEDPEEEEDARDSEEEPLPEEEKLPARPTLPRLPTFLEDRPSSGQRISLLPLTYLMETPALRANPTSGFQSLKRREDPSLVDLEMVDILLSTL
jgi:hypothetical protein